MVMIIVGIAGIVAVYFLPVPSFCSKTGFFSFFSSSFFLTLVTKNILISPFFVSFLF